MDRIFKSALVFLVIGAAVLLWGHAALASEWQVSAGDASQDDLAVSASLATAGTGTGTGGSTSASIAISIGTGSSFFDANAMVSPNVTISVSGTAKAQVAVVLGFENPLTVYHDPDNAMFPWSVNPIDIFIDGSKSFNMFNFEGNLIMGLDPTLNDFVLPLGIFVRIIDNNGQVIKKQSLVTYIYSSNLISGKIPVPW